MLERAVIVAGSNEVLEASDLLLGPPASSEAMPFELPHEGLDLPKLLAEVEEDLISQSLERTRSKQQAAKLLGLQRTTLVQKLRRRAQTEQDDLSE